MWLRLRPTTAAAQGAAVDALFEKAFPMLVAKRAAGMKTLTNPELESAVQYFSKWTKEVFAGNKDLVPKFLWKMLDSIPTDKAFAYNRTQALVEQLLKQNIEVAAHDAFRLAEMSSSRSVAMRSLNHPLFGMYPASYMWGKVVPESLRFLSRNPYSATYTLANVQRSIAIQREYDPEFATASGKFDSSSGAFLFGYLTPGLPWEGLQANLSPAARSILKEGGVDPGKIYSAELATVSPERWFSLFGRTGSEIANLVQSQMQAPPAPPPSGLTPPQQQGLNNISQQSAPLGAQAPLSGGNIGATKATGLAPILSNELTELNKVLQGE